MELALQQTDRIRPVAARLTSEEEAIATARTLAKQFAESASDRDITIDCCRIMSLTHCRNRACFRSRFLSEYGGLDVSNTVLAEVTAILAEADGSIGQIPQNHFYILEALRTDGSEEQKKFFFGRALAGDRFGNALSERGTKTVGHYNTRITRDGLGYRINGSKYYSTGVIFADWIMSLRAGRGRPADHVFRTRAAPRASRSSMIGTVLASGQPAAAPRSSAMSMCVRTLSSFIIKGFERPTTIGSVGQIIHAGVDLGIARAAFAETVDFVKTIVASLDG